MLKYFTVFLLLFIIGTPFSYSIENNRGNPVNDKKLNPNIPVNYSFFVSGHFHGSSKNTSGLPAKTVRENLKRINKEEYEFMVCLGDLFLDIKNDIPAYQKHLINKIPVPLYNAPGNHDKSGSLYEDNFGLGYSTFRLHSELYIFLDTELDNGNIEGDQLSMVKSVLSNLSGIKNVFIFSHRLIWAEEHPKMKHLFTDNTRSGNGNNFRSEILPLIENKSGKNFYLMGGSLGNAPSPFFYYKEKNIIYIATAIRDTPKDAFLKVEIVDGKVKFSAFPLIMPVEYYNLDYYNSLNKPAPGFNWRLVPLYIKTMLFHRYFWYGILMMFLPVAVIYLYKRRKKKL